MLGRWGDVVLFFFFLFSFLPLIFFPHSHNTNTKQNQQHKQTNKQTKNKKQEIWTKFIEQELKINEKTIIIGHSSGAACAMRVIEKRKVGGCVLVSGYDSDLGDDVERGSGYFSREFDYGKMRENCPWVC